MMSADRRPNADELLARLKDEERRAKRGKLTIFFGASPGVGKTYQMLEAARTERDLRRDVVVGVVETHGRYETAALTIGLELLPRRKIEHKGVKLEELDLDAILARRPGIVLVDELAHTNAAGSRHPKRWQDVEELLDAGIDVYTTVNVQHIESLNDVVAQITGVVVRETVPRSDPRSSGRDPARRSAAGGAPRAARGRQDLPAGASAARDGGLLQEGDPDRAS